MSTETKIDDDLSSWTSARLHLIQYRCCSCKFSLFKFSFYTKGKGRLESKCKKCTLRDKKKHRVTKLKIEQRKKNLLRTPDVTIFKIKRVFCTKDSISVNNMINNFIEAIF